MYQQVSLAREADDPCDPRWKDLSSQFVRDRLPADYGGLLGAWKSLEQTCKNTPRYRARLALINFYLDRPEDSKTALATISRDEAEHEPLVQLAQILTDATLLRGGSAHESDLATLEQRLRVYASKNPRDAVGVSLLGDVLGELGRHGAAIEAYEAVLGSMGKSASSVGVMRNLALSYENVGRHEDAYRLAGEALPFDRARLTTDMYFMCAVAKAQAALGKIKGAQDTLTVLATKSPEIREHPDFKAAVEFVKDEMRATTTK